MLFKYLDNFELDIVRRSFIFSHAARGETVDLQFTHQRFVVLFSGCLKLQQTDKEGEKRLVCGILQQGDVYPTVPKNPSRFTRIEGVAVKDVIYASIDSALFWELTKQGYLRSAPWSSALMRFLCNQDRYMHYLMDQNGRRSLARIFLYLSDYFGKNLPISRHDFDALGDMKNENRLLRAWTDFSHKGWISSHAGKTFLKNVEQLKRLKKEN